MGKTGWLPAIVIAGCLALAPAAAHEYDGDTVGPWVYDSAEDEFRGRVGSLEDACQKRRLVKVQELRDSEWETVGKARSKRNARWRLEMTDAEGTFRIVIRPRLKVTIEHDHRCDRYASQGFEIGR